jgi:hypothetical protein
LEKIRGKAVQAGGDYRYDCNHRRS